MSLAPEPRPAHAVDVPDTRQRLLFIGGLGRSGSTLVERLLNEIPSMTAVGETVHLWERGIVNDERCGCGEPFSRCERWRAIGEEAFGGWDGIDVDAAIELRWRVDRTRRLPRLLVARDSAHLGAGEHRYLDRLRPVLLAAGSLAGPGSVVIDSSKHVSTAGLLSLDPSLDVRVLHLVRDPRGVAFSWTKHVARPEADGAPMPRYRPARTALRWVTDNIGFELLGRRVPTLRLRYEDVLAAPDAMLRTIAAFAGTTVDPATALVDGSVAHLHSTLHSVAGNPLRFAGDELVLRRDESWRAGLGGHERNRVTTITAPLLLRYGYPLGGTERSTTPPA